MQYLNDNNLLSRDQFGFRPKHSTCHPMLDVLIQASNALNKKKHMLIIFCDLKKAFDTCDVDILLRKLRVLGVKNTELAWFKSYLSNRSQFMSKLFTDDTALLMCDDYLDNLIRKANLEFQKICKYFRSNKLSLHPNKTKYIVISNSRFVHETVTEISINNNNVGQNDNQLIHVNQRILPSDNIPAIKYLGVYFDPNLNFKFHIQQLNAKLSRALFQIRRVKNILSKDALKTLYYSLFHCHIIYAIEIWSLASKTLINDLYLKQKAVIRLISNAKYNSHTAPLFKELKILPLNMLIQLNLSKIMYYFKNNKLPYCFNGSWRTGLEMNIVTGGPLLRNADDFVVPFARTDHSEDFR
jgi:hypothetical protein